MTQNNQILQHLRQRKSITALEALYYYGSLRLAARIGELKDSGHPIKKQMIKHNGKRFAKYTLEAK